MLNFLPKIRLGMLINVMLKKHVKQQYPYGESPLSPHGIKN